MAIGGAAQGTSIGCIPFHRGEIDCALNLFCSIVGTVVGLISSLQSVLSMPWKDESGDLPDGLKEFLTDVIYGKIVNGMCVSMIFGNGYYAWMSIRMMRAEGRRDVCCLPFGVSTPAAFAFVYNIVARAVQRVAAEGERDWKDGILYAWRVGCVANLISGAIAALVGFAGPAIMKVAPKPALLIALAGLGLTWLGIGQMMDVFAAGHRGFLPMGIALAGYFAGIRFSPLPTAVVVMLAGAATGWIAGDGWPEGSSVKLGGNSEAVSHAIRSAGLYLPSPVSLEALAAIPQVALDSMSVILPVAFVGAINTIVSVYSAHEAGDKFGIKECLIIDGVSTIVAALFGSPFGTTVYIGHQQYKAAGALIYFSFMNCVMFCLLAASGLFAAVDALLPPYAIAPVIIFVGLAINEDAFSAVQAHHLPAAILGLMPSFADWVGHLFPPGTRPPAALSALGYGALLTSIVWVAFTVQVINRRFMQAAMWPLAGSCLAALGIIHQAKADLTFKTFAGSATGEDFAVSPCAFMIGYLSLGALFCTLGVLQRLGVSCVPQVRCDPDDLICGQEEGVQLARRVSQNTVRRNSVAVTPAQESEDDAGYKQLP